MARWRPVSRKGRIIVTGFVGLYPHGAGGVAWDYLQYLLGFLKLGWDAIYVEDTRSWPIFQHGEVSCSKNVAYLAATMEHFGVPDRWAYRDESSGHWFGLSKSAVLEFCHSADIFLNLSCSTALRDEYATIPVRALVDTDPMFTQVQALDRRALAAEWCSMPELIKNHTHRFTIGTSVGSEPCHVPTLGLTWHHTHQPIVMDLWTPSDPPSEATSYYSTVMNWSVFDKLEFDGRQWGQKDVEFMRLLNLPRRVPEVPLAIAVGQLGDPAFPADTIRSAGWKLFDCGSCAPNAARYQDFIAASRGEFSVAKETYVDANTGWFSYRSACYLAAGRPVIAQDTNWSREIPNGRGLLAFDDEESAAEALRRVERDPKSHARAAREIAEECFESSHVLAGMLRVMENET
ncbi:MAG: hypothetical protein JO043_02730 [Candidatus Eremiobacteraeota bacterium]|nr:hypothetical protein [Candidatus Eremiobacteraeota bacterium]